MDELYKNGTKMGRSSFTPALIVAKIDSFFKRMLEAINDELGTDKEKIAHWEENIRKRFNL
ncbi:hypothetical protein LCGC14_1053330 [marine sediment metagenome]|uniref:Uncharacterized protein n=1 Tax=marine sediment metagenome TaxID=412755 RepID=A0A0F9MSS3_9ZZZZ|nr:hypothetical protein [archaeon]